MFIFIPLPSTLYTATAEGSVRKDVACERCGHTYPYHMSRIATGFHKVLFSSPQGPEKALAKARANLVKALETEHDEVPCPECGWHQAAHLAFARSRMYPELKKLAGAFLFLAKLALGVILFIIALGLVVLPDHALPKVSSLLQFALIVLAIASPGLILLGLRNLLALNYRPNRP
jgi:ribosomal protein S27AE